MVREQISVFERTITSLTRTMTVMQALVSRLHLLKPSSGGETASERDWYNTFMSLDVAVKYSFVQTSSWRPSEEEKEPFVAHLFRMDILRKESLLTIARRLSNWSDAWEMLQVLGFILTDLCNYPHAQSHVPADFLEAVWAVVDFAEASAGSDVWNEVSVRARLLNLKNVLERCKSLPLGARTKDANIHDRLLRLKVCHICSRLSPLY